MRALLALLLLLGLIVGGRAQFGGCVGGFCSGPPQIRNILLNGDFSGGTTSWSGFFPNKTVSGGKATFTAQSAFDGVSQGSLVFVIGKYYEITWTLVITSCTMYNYFIGGVTATGSDRTASGTYTERLLTNAGNNTFGFQSKNLCTATVDDISITGPYNTP